MDVEYQINKQMIFNNASAVLFKKKNYATLFGNEIFLHTEGAPKYIENYVQFHTNVN